MPSLPSELFAPWMPWIVAIALNTILLAIARLLPKSLLTPAGFLHAWVLGVVVWGCLGWRGYAVVMFYFLVGSAITRVGMAEKVAAGIAEKRGGARGPENVWGSALTAAVCAIAARILLFAAPASPWVALPYLGYVASFSTKLSDTSASEVGKAYGKHTFLVTTLKPVPRGTEGGVSLEGTLAGIVASVAIALVGWGVGTISPIGIGICAIAAFVANYVESLIGATLQERFDWLTNEVANVANTTVGAIVAIALGWALV